MRFFLTLFLLVAASVSFAQTVPKDVLDAKSKVVAFLKAKQYSKLADWVGPTGLTCYYLFADQKPQRYTRASLPAALRSTRKITWTPAMQGDGGMRDPIRMTLKEYLAEIGRVDWTKSVKARYNSSQAVTYRTLLVEDLKPKHRGVIFIDIAKGDPSISEMREFSTSLTLGFVRDAKTKKLRLAVIGLDQWKD